MNALNKSGFLERTAAASGILGRRGFVVLAAGILQAGGILSARGEDLAASDKAAAFMAETGGKLVGVINGQAQAADKRSALAQIVDDRFDVGGIARFSLGRFWHTATTEQQTLFLTEFRQAVVTNIVAKLGEAPGLRLIVGAVQPRDGAEVIATVLQRPNHADVSFYWVVGGAADDPKIVDWIVEGASLRVTQRSDYVSYLSHNGGSVAALINAMRQQA